MYRYDEYDHALVKQRVAQFRDQTQRRLAGGLTEDEFKPLRLMNGLYLQLHAYMLRVAIPYGVMSSAQLRKLAYIARRFDKGYGHFTTRQNIQFNWPKLEDVPEILEELASVEMHAIQTSGNCIRNTTADQYAGVAADEVEDPRVYCELIRQWSTLHPEFSFLPRKFKIAVAGASQDRAAVRFHDIGIVIRSDDQGEVGFEILVGGGLGRSPFVAKTIRNFLPKKHLLSYLEAILRVYNQLGRRDNKYKARIKVLVFETGIDKFTQLVEEEWRHIENGALTLPAEEVARIKGQFAPPPYEDLENGPPELGVRQQTDTDFARWTLINLVPHKQPGYAIVNLSLKPIDGVPGDMTAEQMDTVAGLAERYSFGEITSTHEQNLIFAHVRQKDLFDLWRQLKKAGLATPNVGLISDIICCPGMDYCSLATARSIPVAQRISDRFRDLKQQYDIGELRLKMSGCINACGHHHAGHIGILGVDRKGEEFYQITLGGSADENAAIGQVIGPAFSSDAVVDAVTVVVETYLQLRQNAERFIDTYWRTGPEPFKEKLYAAH